MSPQISNLKKNRAQLGSSLKKCHLFTLIRTSKFRCYQTKSLRNIRAFPNFCPTPYSGWFEQNNLFDVFVSWNTGCQWYCTNGQIGISFTHGRGGSSISSTDVTVFFLQLRWGTENYFCQAKQMGGGESHNSYQMIEENFSGV